MSRAPGQECSLPPIHSGTTGQTEPPGRNRHELVVSIWLARRPRGAIGAALCALISILAGTGAQAATYPAPVASHYAPEVAMGFSSCTQVIDRYGHRSPTHGRGSMLNRFVAVSTCRVAVEIAHKIGHEPDVVAHVVPAWGIQESSWAAAAFGTATEVGPLQIKRATCGDAIDRPCTYGDDLATVVRASLLYYQRLHRYGSGWHEALSAYRVGGRGWSQAQRCMMRGDCTETDRARRYAGQRYADQVTGRVEWLRGRR